MTRHQERLDRIDGVAKEYLAARSASALLERKLQEVPSFGVPFGWNKRFGKEFVANLEKTYLVRVYAEFEAGLREYWTTHEGEATRPGMSQLVGEALAARRRIPSDTVDGALKIVYLRNYLVHEIDDETRDVPVNYSFEVAKSFLRAFFYRLNRRW